MQLFFVVVLACLVFGSCEKSSTKNLETASQLIKERPDSAYILLQDIDYYELDNDSLRAKYILTRALANVKIGRSLITDTLLNQASTYYLSTGDTANWVISSQLLSGYDYYRGKPELAIERLKSISTKVNNPELLWDTYWDLFEISHNTGSYKDAYEYADWLLQRTDRPEQILKFVTAKAASQYFQGNHTKAVELMGSIIEEGILENVDKSISDEFYLEYAEMLNGNRQTQKAVEILLSIYPDDKKLSDGEKIYKRLSLAQYYANLGNTAKAKELLDSINHMGTGDYFEVYTSIAMLKAALQYKETGRFPTELMHESSKNIDLKHRMARFDRETALDSVMELSENNYKLIIERQRLWLSLSIISFVLIAGAICVYFIINHRKRKLINAEERIEALNEILEEVQNSKENDDGSSLKKLALQQMGIFRVFASSPGQMSREALKKISGIGDKALGVDKLMDWDNLYTMVDQLYDNFHLKLAENYPGLFSQKEIQIICLMKADFTTKEIAFITEQSTATIYVRKSSIRKKLNAPENSDIIAEIENKWRE